MTTTQSVTLYSKNDISEMLTPMFRGFYVQIRYGTLWLLFDDANERQIIVDYLNTTKIIFDVPESLYASSYWLITFSNYNALAFLEHFDKATDENKKLLLGTSAVQFNIKKTDLRAVVPFKNRYSDAGFDLTLIKFLKEANGVRYYDTGIAIQSFGYYFTVEERSGAHKQRFSLANKRGIIDAEYTGSIIVADAGGTELVLPAVVVQLIPHKNIHGVMNVVDDFEETTRKDTGGLGSKQFTAPVEVEEIKEK